MDLNEKVWITLANRMKAEREHQVPLTPRMRAILTKMRGKETKDNPHVFTGRNHEA